MNLKQNLNLHEFQVNKLKWSKKLYLKTGHPDNYVDESFLDLKRTNVNAQIYTYWNSVYYSGLIHQQISSIVLFVLIYVYLRMDLLSINDLMSFYVVPIVLFAYLVKIFTNKFNTSELNKDLFNLLKFVAFTYGSSPILNSLTESISSDTIYAGTSFMLFLNLIFHDYDSPDTPMVSKTFSFNAALFASVCLASRFTTSSFHTFCLITIAFILFAIWPESRKYLKKRYPKSVIIITVVNLVICLAMLSFLRLWSLAFIYSTTFLIITFICPALLVKLQVYKNTIHGPWDEAIIR